MKDSTIPFVIERSKKRRKSIAILVTKTRGVVVQAPHRMPEAYIHEVIEERKAWIQKKWIAIQAHVEEKKEYYFENGEAFLYLGEPHTLEIWPIPAAKNQCELIGKTLLVRIAKTSKFTQEVQVKKNLEAWYHKQAKDILVARSQYFAELLHVKPGEIMVKEQKSRWGSCDSDNNIRYNWKVVMVPMHLIDYLVVHELAHIKEKNHSAAFWDVVLSILPDCHERRKALKVFHVEW